MSELIDDILIVNKALIKIGQAPIDSLENAQNKASRLAALLLPQAKKYIFRLHPWNCLRDRAVVVLSAEKPAFGFVHKYALPASCLRPLAIQTDDGTFVPFYNATYGGSLPSDKQFVIEGRYILTDTAPHSGNEKGQVGLNFVYIVDPDNLDVLDSDLVEVLSYYLAIEMCYDLTGSVSYKQQLIAEYKEALKRARAINAQEVAPGISIGQVIGAHY